MLNYVKKNKLEILILSIWIVVLYSYKILFHVVGVDTEEALISFASSLNWTLGSGRFVSALLRKILMPLGFNYDIAILLTIVGWGAVCISYQYCLSLYGDFNRLCKLFFSLLFVSCPIWAEQSYFMCSVFVNVIGILCAIWAAHILVQIIQNEFRQWHLIGAIVLIIISVGIYQALLYLIVANCIIFLSINSYTKNIVIGNYILSGVKCIAYIVIATLFYMCCSKIVITLFYNPLMDYAGYENATLYITSRIMWGKENALSCLKYIWEYICNSLSPENVYGFPSLIVFWGIIQTYYLLGLIIKKQIKNATILIGNLLLLISVYLGCIMSGTGVATREQLVIPVAISFFALIFINEVFHILDAKINNKEKLKYYRMVLVICSLYCVWIWGSKYLFLNRSDYVRYNLDVNYTNKIINEIQSVSENYSEKKIVFIGSSDWELPENYICGEMIGTSVFSWDCGGPVGVNYRAYGFLNSCGYYYVKPSVQEVKKIQKLCANQKVFEGNSSVIIMNDYIVVDLNHL